MPSPGGAEESLRRQSAVLSAINRVLGLGDRTEEELGQACLDLVEPVTASKISFIGEIRPDGLLHDVAISLPGWGACAMRDKAGHRTRN